VRDRGVLVGTFHEPMIVLGVAIGVWSGRVTECRRGHERSSAMHDRFSRAGDRPLRARFEMHIASDTSFTLESGWYLAARSLDTCSHALDRGRERSATSRRARCRRSGPLRGGRHGSNAPLSAAAHDDKKRFKGLARSGGEFRVDDPLRTASKYSRQARWDRARTFSSSNRRCSYSRTSSGRTSPGTRSRCIGLRSTGPNSTSCCRCTDALPDRTNARWDSCRTWLCRSAEPTDRKCPKRNRSRRGSSRARCPQRGRARRRLPVRRRLRRWHRERRRPSTRRRRLRLRSDRRFARPAPSRPPGQPPRKRGTRGDRYASPWSLFGGRRHALWATDTTNAGRSHSFRAARVGSGRSQQRPATARLPARTLATMEKTCSYALDRGRERSASRRRARCRRTCQTWLADG
jgi:hypothetical protein